jgi:O-antigen ligase
MQSPILKISIAVLMASFLSTCVVMQLPWTYLAGFFFVLIFSLVFFAKPLHFLAFLLFLRAGVDAFLVQVRFPVGGADLGLAGGFSLLLVVLTLAAFLVEGDKNFVRRLNHPLIKVFAFFCLFTVVNSLYAYDRTFALKTILKNFSVLAIVVLAVMRVKKEEDAFFLMKAVVLSFIPVVVIGFLSGDYMMSEIRGLRYIATLTHPNILAFFVLLLLACFLAGLHRRSDDIAAKRWSRLGLLVLIVMLLFTKTRSGQLAAALLFFFFAWHKNRKLILPILLACIGLAMLPMVRSGLDSLFTMKYGRLEVVQGNNFSWRLEKWGHLFSEGIHKPIHGHGMGASRSIGDHLAAHNDYAQFFVEGGLIGLFLYFFPLFYLLKNAGRMKRRTEPDSFVYKLSDFFLMFIPPFLIMSISENLASYVVVQWYFWAVVGIYISLSWNLKNAAK